MYILQGLIEPYKCEKLHFEKITFLLFLVLLVHSIMLRIFFIPFLISYKPIINIYLAWRIVVCRLHNRLFSCIIYLRL